MSMKAEMVELAEKIDAKFNRLNELAREQHAARNKGDMNLFVALEHEERTLYIQVSNFAFRLAWYVVQEKAS